MSKTRYFTCSFASLLFKANYAIAAGLGPALDFLRDFHFRSDDLTYLQTLSGNDGRPLFGTDFLDYLAELRLTCDIDAVPEGSLVFEHEPLLRVQGPILQCQLLETALLNIINFQTLIATKAARICSIAGDDPVLEFGLRRAQGIDGGLAASRAAYLGGCSATSNVLAGKLYGIPVKGTHAHSWVMSFDEEETAFREYSTVLPNNCVFLVDTYDTLNGVRKAIKIGQELRALGHEMVGIRLDSGNLAELSIQARQLLDASNFQSAAIIASNDLDEYAMQKLKNQGAKIGVWGIGTKLATAYDQPALGGVYKLGAIQDATGQWAPKIKLSEQKIKTSIPGKLQIKRFYRGKKLFGDVLINELEGADPAKRSVNLRDSQPLDLSEQETEEDLLQPALRTGAVVTQDSLEQARTRAHQQLRMFSPAGNPSGDAAPYPVALDVGLHELRERLIQSST